MERASFLKHTKSDNNDGKCSLLPFELIWAFFGQHTRYFLPSRHPEYYIFHMDSVWKQTEDITSCFFFFCPKLNAFFVHVSAFEAR